MGFQVEFDPCCYEGHREPEGLRPGGVTVVLRVWKETSETDHDLICTIFIGEQPDGIGIHVLDATGHYVLHLLDGQQEPGEARLAEAISKADMQEWLDRTGRDRQQNPSRRISGVGSLHNQED